jgi:DNA-binding MarR family transcriptional regulator
MIDNNDSILKGIGLTSKGLSIYINDKMVSHGIDLTRQQYVLLKVLFDKEGSSQNDLAFLTERDKTSLTRLLRSLENKGLVSKITGKVDRRKRRIYLTEPGKQMLNKAWPIMKEIEYELTIDLDPIEVQTTLKVLKSVQAKVFSEARVLT